MASTTKAQDVVDVILAQHQQVKQLLSDMASGHGDATETFCELRRMIAVHETAEQEIVYPVLRSEGDQGRRVVTARTAEEAEGTTVLFELEKLDIGTPKFTALFAKFRTAVLEHAQNEENEVLPLLRKQSAARRSSMAQAFVAAEKVAPTHAHPHAPTSAVGNLVTGPALAIMDRVRDAIHKS